MTVSERLNLIAATLGAEVGAGSFDAAPRDVRARMATLAVTLSVVALQARDEMDVLADLALDAAHRPPGPLN